MQVLDFIRKEVAGGRQFPSISRIAQEFGWRDSGARDAIDRLLIRGHVQRAKVSPNAKSGSYIYSIPPDRKCSAVAARPPGCQRD